MLISYEKLWRQLQKNKMKKSELAKATRISSYTMAKLNRNEPVHLDVMVKFCKVFHCDIGELMEVIEEN